MIKQKGQSLIEILLAAALLILLLPAIFSSLMTTREGRLQQKNRIDASYFLKETQEEVRIIRERGWDLFANNGTFHPEADGNTWVLASNPETISGLTRQVVISNAFRNEFGQLGDIGELDASTKEVEVTVSWDEPFPSSVSSTFYLTRYLENISYSESTENDFLLGNTDGTVVVNDFGGEVILGAGGQGSWCNPDSSIKEEFDLPKQGVANAVSAIEGRVIAGTGDNASGVSMALIGISNDNPPVATLDGDFDGFKTNDVFVEQNYAYLATDTNKKEIVIINISGTPSESGYVDLSGSTNADAVHVSGSTGFAIQGSTFWTLDFSSKIGKRSALDSVSLAGIGTEVVVVGDYAYVSTKSNTELQIIDVSNPSNISIVAQANVNGGDGMDIAVNSTGTRAYLATSNDASKDELFIINTESKSGNQPVVGSLSTGDMDPKAVAVVPGNKIIIGGHGGEEYQVINITSETNPTSCGSLDLGFNINDLDAVLESDGDAYSYVITTESNNELKIIEGGPGGDYSTEGTFESGIFDANFDTVFNRFETIETVPTSADISYQIAVADDIGGSCAGASYYFIGPDGTNSTFFETGGPIPLDNDGVGFENPGQCFRFKVYFSSQDSSSTAIFEEISVNYSP